MPLQACPSQQCGSGQRCIPFAKLCDTQVDCLNAEDEISCRDSNYVRSHDYDQTTKPVNSLHQHSINDSFCELKDNHSTDKTDDLNIAKGNSTSFRENVNDAKSESFMFQNRNSKVESLNMVGHFNNSEAIRNISKEDDYNTDLNYFTNEASTSSSNIKNTTLYNIQKDLSIEIDQSNNLDSEVYETTTFNVIHKLINNDTNFTNFVHKHDKIQNEDEVVQNETLFNNIYKIGLDSNEDSAMHETTTYKIPDDFTNGIETFEKIEHDHGEAVQNETFNTVHEIGFEEQNKGFNVHETSISKETHEFTDNINKFQEIVHHQSGVVENDGALMQNKTLFNVIDANQLDLIEGSNVHKTNSLKILDTFTNDTKNVQNFGYHHDEAVQNGTSINTSNTGINKISNEIHNISSNSTFSNSYSQSTSSFNKTEKIIYESNNSNNTFTEHNHNVETINKENSEYNKMFSKENNTTNYQKQNEMSSNKEQNIKIDQINLDHTNFSKNIIRIENTTEWQHSQNNNSVYIVMSDVNKKNVNTSLGGNDASFSKSGYNENKIVVNESKTINENQSNNEIKEMTTNSGNKKILNKANSKPSSQRKQSHLFICKK